MDWTGILLARAKLTGALDLFVWNTRGEEWQRASLVAFMLGSDARVERQDTGEKVTLLT